MSKAKIQSSGKRKRALNAVSIPSEVIINTIFVLFCAACIIPFIFVVIISFTSTESIRQIGFSFFPVSWSLEAYQYIKDLGQQLWVSYFNSFFITIVGTALSVLMIYIVNGNYYRNIRIHNSIHYAINTS